MRFVSQERLYQNKHSMENITIKRKKISRIIFIYCCFSFILTPNARSINNFGQLSLVCTFNNDISSRFELT